MRPKRVKARGLGALERHTRRKGGMGGMMLAQDTRFLPCCASFLVCMYNLMLPEFDHLCFITEANVDGLDLEMRHHY